MAGGGRLVGLQPGADIVSHVDVGNVDRHDLERGARVEALRKDGLRDAVGIFEDFLVIDGRTDGADHALADPGDDRRLAGAADVPFEVAAHGDPRLHVELNTVLCHALNRARHFFDGG